MSKALFLLAIVIAACAGTAAAAAAQSQDVEQAGVDTTSGLALTGFTARIVPAEERLSYEQARTIALAWLANPGTLDGELVDLAGRAAAHLARARFQVAVDADGDSYCARRVAALFVLQEVPDTIFVCADTRWHVRQGAGPVDAILAQGFLHEAAHLAGMADECQATLLEMLVAGNNSDAIGYANLRRYAGQCAVPFKRLRALAKRPVPLSANRAAPRSIIRATRSDPDGRQEAVAADRALAGAAGRSSARGEIAVVEIGGLPAASGPQGVGSAQTAQVSKTDQRARPGGLSSAANRPGCADAQFAGFGIRPRISVARQQPESPHAARAPKALMALD